MANANNEANKAQAALCRGVDKKDDAMMMMAPDCNWDQFLTPAPLAIAILGDLILISADRDFSLEEKPPKDGFKFLRYPNSFRASLVQVSNAGWDAFNEAHTSMDQIRLHTGNVDTHVKNAVKFLLQGTPAEVQKMLPLSLTKIQNIADESLNLAQAIEGGVMQLTGELLEACTSAKGTYYEKSKDIERAIKVAKTEEELRAREKEEQRRRLENMDKEVTQAQEGFKQAVDSIPTGMNLIGLAAGDALIDGMRNLTSLPGMLAQSAKKRINKVFEEESDDEDTQDGENLDIASSKRQVYLQINNIETQINTLKELATGNEDSQIKPTPIWNRISNGEVTVVKKFLQTSISNVAKENAVGELQEKVIGICKEAIKVCDNLDYMVKNMTVDDKEERIDTAVKEVCALAKICKPLNVKAAKMLGKNPLDSKSPHLAKMQQKSSSTSIAQSAVEESRYKTELAKETLKDAKRRQEQTEKELRETNEKLIKIFKEMASLDLDKIDFDSIRDTLVKGIKALAQVREQWGKLVRFFQMLSNLIKCCLHSSLTNFVDQANIGRELKSGDVSIPLSDIFRDVIFEQASKASQVSYVVNTISATYVEISNKHLMDRITSLGHLIALDPKQDGHEITRRREELHNGCEKAQREIKAIVLKQKEEFATKIDERIAKIAALEAKMPPIKQEKIQEIQNAVSEGFTDNDMEDLI